MSAPDERAGWGRSDYVMAIAQASLEVTEPLFRSEQQRNAGRLAEALAGYEQIAVALERQIDLSEDFNQRFDPPREEVAPVASTLANSLMTAASVAEGLNDRPRAEALRQRGLALATRYLPPQDVAARMRELAASRAAQNRFHEAITLLAEARDALATRGDALAVADVVAQLAETLEWLGDKARARDEATRAMALIEPLLPAAGPSMANVFAALLGGDLAAAVRRTDALKVWMQLAQLDARLSRDLGDRARATELFSRVRAQAPSFVSAGVDFQLARVVVEDGRAAEGLAQLSALEPEMSGMLRPKLGVLLTWKARALRALGRTAEATADAERAVADLAAYADLDALWRARALLGDLLARAGRDREALAHLVAAVDTINILRRGSLGYRLDSTYLADKLPVVDAALDLAVALDDAGTACAMIEFVKARALTAILSAPPRAAPPAAPDALDVEFEALSRDLDQLAYGAFATGWSDEVLESRRAMLETRRQLLERVRARDPRWRSLSEATPFDLNAVRLRLRAEGRAAITLYLRGGDLVAVLVDGDGCAVARSELPPRTVAALERYRASLDAGYPVDPAASDGLALEDLLPAPLIERAARGSAVLISPHGFLHLLPWSMLPWRGARLFEHLPVGVTPNLSCVGLLPPSAGGAVAVGLVGAPAYRERAARLPMAEAELDEIANAYLARGRVLGDVLTGTRATEAAFRALASREDADRAVLHVACHGDFVAEEPLYSGLLLADAKVDAAEIAHLRLRYEQVVLSACSSGYRSTAVRDVPLSGDDVVGLVGSLLEAGASSVLVSISRAHDDATYAFMTTYHTRRAGGSGPLLALQQTQQDMLASGTYDPSLWAGFALYGG